ncbi:hypothetical protein BDA99DRAFT_494660 [Phascolomyces articulosus]|uniref:Uncharacterized protein n=1 Tax=Phascolomyces articulosus TaxID=60185 RepID=A0AAD5PIR2_9FUNG|nr:hypothetical protein BDA99DRAFT_494660 [Phascolomyces articulosus]
MVTTNRMANLATNPYHSLGKITQKQVMKNNYFVRWRCIYVFRSIQFYLLHFAKSNRVESYLSIGFNKYVIIIVVLYTCF